MPRMHRMNAISVPKPVEAARMVTLLARTHTPKAIETLVGILDDSVPEEKQPEAVRVLRGLMRNAEEESTQRAAASSLLQMQKSAADALLSVARLIEARLEDDPGVRDRTRAPGVTVVINRQGRDLTIESGGQRMQVRDEDMTVDGEIVSEKLSS